MGQIKMDETERSVLELKRHLLESEVRLNKPTLDQLIMYGVLTTDKAHEIRSLPDGKSQMEYFLAYLEEGKPGTVKALARALTRDYILVAESLMFEQHLAEGIYADDEQLHDAYEQAGRDIHREFNTSKRIAEGEKSILQQIVGERFLFAQRVYGRQLMKTKAAVSHQQMIGDDLERTAKQLNYKAIQMTDELRQKFVSILGTVVQGGSMISGHDNRSIQDLFYSAGGSMRDNSALEDLDKQFQEIIRLTNRSLMEMDYLKDEKFRILENLGLDVEANMNKGLDVIVREIMDQYDAQIKDRECRAAERDQDRRVTQMDLDNFHLDNSKKLENMDRQIWELQLKIKDVAPEVAFEIENVENLRRELRNDNQELEMWKQTCLHLENGQNLNKMYEHKLQKLMTDSDRSETPDTTALPKVILRRYNDLLKDGKELLRETDKVLQNEYSEFRDEELGYRPEMDKEHVVDDGKDGTFTYYNSGPSPRVKSDESRLGSHSSSTIVSEYYSKDPRAEDDLGAKTPRRDNVSRSTDRSASKLTDKGQAKKTGNSGREIMTWDQPWGAKVRRDKTWCVPGRFRNRPDMSREEKRQNREKPWVLSKEKKAILREGSFYDVPISRAETSFRDRPKTRARSEMQFTGRPVTRSESKKQRRPDTRADPTVPLKCDLSPRQSRKSRTGGREVSFSLSEDRQKQNNMNNRNQGPMMRSLDTPLTYYNVHVDESFNNGSSNSKTRPDTVSPLILGESMNAGKHSPGSDSPSSPREAWLYTPKSKPTEKEVAFYKSPDLAISEVESSNKPHNQFIPKNKPVKKSRNRTKSKDEKPLDQFGGTMASWSADPSDQRPNTRAGGLEGPRVSQMTARPQTRGYPTESSARENDMNSTI